MFHTSVYMRVPMKTNKVPSQCHRVKGFWKYKMEKMRLTNLRSVTTRVTVREPGFHPRTVVPLIG